MSLTVLHISNQILAYQLLAGIGIRQHFLQGFDDNIDNFNVLLLIVSAYIVGFK